MRTIKSDDFRVTFTADHEQYYQGHGIAFSHYDESATGCGETLMEAFQDALESLAQQDIEISDVQEALLLNELRSLIRGHRRSALHIPVNDKRAGYCTSRKTEKHREDCSVCSGEWHFYVSIDVCLAEEKVGG